MSVVTRLLHSRAADLLRFEANRHLRPHDEGRRVLVVGGGSKAMRGYILAAIHRQGFPVTLLCEAPPTWESAYIDRYVVADLASPEAAMEAVRQEVREHPVGGVLTYVETEVPLAARISRELGLRLFGPEVAERVRDKSLMRRCLAEAGLVVPKLAPVEEGDVRAAVAEVGLPAVFKPVRGEGSIHVLKLEDERGIAEAERLVAKSREDRGWKYGGYLVEEYVGGEEYSVESVIADGRILHAAMTDKYKGAEPYFEEISHTVPTRLGAAEVEETLEVVTRAVRALGLDNCAVHTELKRGPMGIVVIEVGGRLAGGRIPRLVELARGVDMSDAVARAAVGLSLEVAPQAGRFASVGFFVPAYEQTQRGELVARPLVPGLVDFEFWGRAGQEHGVPPKTFLLRLGYAVTVAGTYEESRAMLERTRSLVTSQTGVEFLPFVAAR
ncbi:MAG TPA: ATP-grasp domain-containing protein [Myxococcales bacterium]|jgi:biotin carboxylase